MVAELDADVLVGRRLSWLEKRFRRTLEAWERVERGGGGRPAISLFRKEEVDSDYEIKDIS